MAAETTIAREGRVKTINAINGQGRTRTRANNPISFSDGRGGTRKMNLSSDNEANDAMRQIAKKFIITKDKGDAAVDDYIRKENDGSYTVKVWGIFGNSWWSDKSYGQIINLKNNPDFTLRMKKTRGGQWIGTLTQRNYYGIKDKVEQLIWR